MRYPANTLRILTATSSHKDTNINFLDIIDTDTYLDFIYNKMQQKAEIDHEDHISMPCGLRGPEVSAVMSNLRNNGYKVDMSRSGTQGVCMLNIGWGPGYVIGGNAPLLN